MGMKLTKPPSATTNQQKAQHETSCNCIECRLERLEYGRDKHLVWLVHELVGGFALLVPTMAKIPQFKELEQELREFQELIERVCREIEKHGASYMFTG